MKTLEELKNENNSGFKNRLVHEIRGLAWAFFIVILFRTVLVQFFIVPTGSMYPNVIIGDCLYATKFSYGYSRASFPFGHYFSSLKGRLFESTPNRGDVIVMINPLSPDQDYIKRLVGLPGDRIQVRQGILHINDQPVKLERIEDYRYVYDREGRSIVVAQFLETFPGDTKSHRIIKTYDFGKGKYDNTEEFLVPADHFFFMGDNRDNSLDSRVVDVLGMVHKDYLIGHAIGLFFSTSARWFEPIKWVTGIKWERVGNFIR